VFWKKSVLKKQIFFVIAKMTTAKKPEQVNKNKQAAK
jgi:hypothetical protein